MFKLLIRPSLHTEWPLPVRPVIRSMSLGLANLKYAVAGDLLGFALGHDLGSRHVGGSVTECNRRFTMLNRYRCEMPTPDMLRRAA